MDVKRGREIPAYQLPKYSQLHTVTGREAVVSTFCVLTSIAQSMLGDSKLFSMHAFVYVQPLQMPFIPLFKERARPISFKRHA